VSVEVVHDEGTGFVPRQVAIDAVHFRARPCADHEAFDADCAACRQGSACEAHRDLDLPWTSWFHADCPHCVACKDVVADYGTIAHHHVDASQLATEEELLAHSTLVWRDR
jgi:hypothetical protein